MKAFVENFAAAFLKEEETEIGSAAAVFKYHMYRIQSVVEQPGFLAPFHRKVKANFLHIQLKHFGRHSIKFPKLILIKMGGVALQLKKGKRK